MHSLTDDDRKNLVTRLRRIEGQVRGIERMIDEDKYCVDILTQVTAARNALTKVGLRVLEQHIQGCVRNVLQHDEDDRIIEELLYVIEKFTD